MTIASSTLFRARDPEHISYTRRPQHPPSGLGVAQSPGCGRWTLHGCMRERDKDSCLPPVLTPTHGAQFQSPGSRYTQDPSSPVASAVAAHCCARRLARQAPHPSRHARPVRPGPPPFQAGLPQSRLHAAHSGSPSDYNVSCPGLFRPYVRQGASVRSLPATMHTTTHTASVPFTRPPLSSRIPGVPRLTSYCFSLRRIPRFYHQAFGDRGINSLIEEQLGAYSL